MKPTQAILAVTAPLLKDSVPEFGVGDSVRVSVKVVEGTRERTQVFEGVVMRRRGGGINANFTVRRIASHGIGVERTFLLHSPRVEKIEVTRRGVVRRAQLYYLRGLTGKAARIKERRYRPGTDGKAAKARTATAVVAEAPLEDAQEPEVFAPEMLEPDLIEAEEAAEEPVGIEEAAEPVQVDVVAEADAPETAEADTEA